MTNTSLHRSAPEVSAEELLTAACEAMGLLQDRQENMPEEMLDPRERRVLKQLRAAFRDVAGDEGL